MNAKMAYFPVPRKISHHPANISLCQEYVEGTAFNMINDPLKFARLPFLCLPSVNLYLILLLIMYIFTVVLVRHFKEYAPEESYIFVP